MKKPTITQDLNRIQTREATADKTRPFGTLQKLEVANAAGITADLLIDLFYTLHMWVP